MDKVNFIHTEVDTDIIISLSFNEDTEFGIGGFMIMGGWGQTFKIRLTIISN
jgi:hypothetical protein